jgi:predicted metal-binding membrane protein
MNVQRASDRTFLGVSALLFAASAAVTIAWCRPMSAMDGMAWMRMPGQTWAGAAASFVGMWMAMMLAMMLPSLVPMLWRYRQAVREARAMRLNLLTFGVGMGYFFVWAVIGIAAYPPGVALAGMQMSLPSAAHALPFGVGAAVVIAGALQFSAWKAHHLACCREAAGGRSLVRAALEANSFSAVRFGIRLGVHCAHCCAGLTAILLVIGVMDVRAMTIVTACITTERLAPAGALIARALGVIIIGAGLVLIAHAL